MRMVQMVLTVALVLLIGAPANAATPDMVDECGGHVYGGNGYAGVRPGHVDLCAAWFTASESALQVSLEVAIPPTSESAIPVVDGSYQVLWQSGSCTYGVVLDATVGAEMAEAFTVTCGEPEVECTVPELLLNCSTVSDTQLHALPDGSIAWDGDRLVFSVPFAGDLAPFAAAHADGSVLRRARAWSSTTAGPISAWAFHCGGGFTGDRCTEIGGDFMGSTGDVVLRS